MYAPTIEDLTAVGARQSALHERAADLTRSRFGRHVFVRAVVEVSNYCRENCRYCGMRRDNSALDRYRANLEALAEGLICDRPASVTEVSIQAGEDPVAVRTVVLPLIRLLRRETRLGVIVCLGTLDAPLYRELKSAGASIYILKFETADPTRYEAFEAPGNLAERLAHIRLLAAQGWRVSSGFIVGLPGDGPGAWLKNLGLARSLPLAGCSVSPFIPGAQTPLAGAPNADAGVTLNCMSALRLMRPDWVVPAVSALNLAAEDGYRRGLRAGANLVTMNLTPPQWRRDYVIYRRDRLIMTEERILAALDAEGLTPSPAGWVERLASVCPAATVAASPV